MGRQVGWDMQVGSWPGRHLGGYTGGQLGGHQVVSIWAAGRQQVGCRQACGKGRQLERKLGRQLGKGRQGAGR